ncbi:sensor histidine kinase [Agrococcus citreus]|uniref:GAF domain-containing protein n=1 Tax=Agrococcus citreus TaxID=84643 RepID=A0ABP4JE20_9MICO
MNADPSVHFPDLPRSELEQAISELVDKANRVLDTQGRLRQLLVATRAVGDALELPVLLRRIAQAAVDLVGAQYGALGVIGVDGDLEQFIHVGLDDETAARIGELPRGRGILGAVISDPTPIRLDHLSSDMRSHGFPAHHPAMRSFLGVPVRIRDEVFGNLYLTNRIGGGPFTDEDEELLMALATSAAVAIDNARLYGDAELRQRWALASAETAAALLDAQTLEPLQTVAQTIARLTDAAVVCFVELSERGGAFVESAWGDEADAFRDRVYPAAASMSETVIASGNPRLSPGVPYPDSPFEMTGPAMVVPINRANGTRGALAIARPNGASAFRDPDLDMVMEFAVHASVALELRKARLTHERLALLEDRNRIARDLHDNVIQRLFGAGLALNGVDRERLPPAARAKVELVTDLLDEAIAEIRKSVFALHATSPHRPAARHRLLDVVSGAADAFPNPPQVSLEGDFDRHVPESVLADLEAVLREGLSNAARHAAADSVSVRVAALAEEIRVTVRDDGQGPAGAIRSSGLTNLSERARAWGGSAALEADPAGGSVLEWRIPTPAREEGST